MLKHFYRYLSDCPIQFFVAPRREGPNKLHGRYATTLPERSAPDALQTTPFLLSSFAVRIVNFAT